MPKAPDLNNPDSAGAESGTLQQPERHTLSTSLGYLNPSRHRLNLTLRPNCAVRRVLFDGNRATGLEVESGGEIFNVEGDEIILSGGAIASPQLLMLSGVGPAEHLREMGIPVVRDTPEWARTCETIPSCS